MRYPTNLDDISSYPLGTLFRLENGLVVESFSRLNGYSPSVTVCVSFPYSAFSHSYWGNGSPKKGNVELSSKIKSVYPRLQAANTQRS